MRTVIPVPWDVAVFRNKCVITHIPQSHQHVLAVSGIGSFFLLSMIFAFLFFLSGLFVLFLYSQSSKIFKL